MDATQEINALLGVIDENHKFFDYLNAEQKLNIKNDIENTLTHTVLFKKEDKELFAAVVQVYENFIHVLEVGGNFPRNIKFLETYCHGLAMFLKKNKITVCTRREGVGRIAEKLNFVLDENRSEYYKEV